MKQVQRKSTPLRTFGNRRKKLQDVLLFKLPYVLKKHYYANEEHTGP